MSDQRDGTARGFTYRVTGDPPADITVEYLEEAIAAAPEDLPLDDQALLWMSRGTLLGHELDVGYLETVLDVSKGHAQLALIRLVKRGAIERVEA